MSQFGFRGSPTVQQLAVSSPTPPPGAASSTTAVTGGPAGGAGGGSPAAAAPPRCCDTGRPIFTDPLTGQSVCSCQYDLLGYQRLASAGVGAAAAAAAAASLPALSVYSTPYADGMAAYFPALGADQAPFYTTAAGLDLKENLATGAATWPYPSVYHPYDAAFAGYPFNGYGMDLNGARRKNATRETTSTLKAWLNEHKKNPYPTKGEKIMLAIITKMTLTQVSTWFANARRRLKKENKMTWEPRNRVEDEDNNNDDDVGGRKSADNVKDPDSKDSGTASSEDGDRPPHPALDTASEWSESRPDSGPDSPECLFERPSHAAAAAAAYQLRAARLPSPPPPKPRIWSLADMASKESEPPPTSVSTSAAAAAATFYSAGKLVSPLATRGVLQHPHHPHHLPHLHHPSAYPRPAPHDLYRSFYGSAGHLAAAAVDASLLETYSRTFGGGGSGGPLSSALSKAGAPFTLNGGGGGPLGLTVTTSAASSSSSNGSELPASSALDAKLAGAADAKHAQANKA